MKTKLIALLLFASITLGAGEDPNNPILCEQTFEEGYYVGSYLVLDPNGLKYPDNILTRTWTSMPWDVEIIEIDCSQPDPNRPMDLCKGYTFLRTLIEAGDYTVKFHDTDGSGNVTYSEHRVHVTPVPDVVRPVPACGKYERR